MSPVASNPVLTVRHAHKRFGAVYALQDVSLEARRGEVLALLGDNSAGKPPWSSASAASTRSMRGKFSSTAKPFRSSHRGLPDMPASRPSTRTLRFLTI